MRRLSLAIAAVALVASATLTTVADADVAQRTWSTIPPGPYSGLPVTAHNLTVSDGTHISYAVYRPDVPAGTRVPVILTAGPYFALLEEPVTVPSSNRLSGFLIDNFVSHGYAVVAASVRGTGWSGGCMELMSAREAKDLDELVTHLAGEPWSSGAVGMIGKSYDGATPWMVASRGNPHLKTIVPIAGLTDLGDVSIHHGAAEMRAAIMPNAMYWLFGFGIYRDPTHFNEGRALADRAANAACPEMVRGTAAAAYSTATGDIRTAPIVTDYWAERNWRPGTLAAFGGSVFIVHGLQDYNVNPSQAVPFFGDLPQEKKMWLGSWEHHYPDEDVEARRADFAATLKAWFDRHLKGLDVDTGPVVEVADVGSHEWRTYDAWPDPTAHTAFGLQGDFTLAPGAGAPFRKAMAAPAGVYLFSSCSSAVHLPPWSPVPEASPDGAARFGTTVADATRVSGVPVVELRFDPATAGNVVVTMCAGWRVLTQGATSMGNADASGALTPYVPGLPLTVRVELEPTEYAFRAGERLQVTIAIDDRSYDNVPRSAGVAVLTGGTLTLPVA